MKTNNLQKILCAIFILAFFLRLFAVFTQEESKRLPLADAKDYDNIAVNIVSGYGLSRVNEGERVPTSFRPPLYPLFLAGIYAIFGHSYMAVKIIQAILGALFCIAIFFIATIIFDSRRIGIIASTLTALYKPFISGFNYYGGPAILYSEYFYIFIFGLAILMTALFIKKRNKIFGILSGIFIGLTMFTRFEFILYPFLLFIYLIYVSRLSIKRAVAKYFIMYFFIMLTLTPWVIRNYIVHEKFIPLSTLGNYIFWMGNNSLANGGGAYPEDYAETMEKIKGLPEYEKNKVFLRKTVEELKSNPKRIPRLIIKKILVHWAPFENGFELFNPYYAIILLFAGIGIAFFRRSSIMEDMLLMVFLSTTLTAVITLGEPRYRYPYESCLIIFAAVAMDEIFIRIRRK